MIFQNVVPDAAPDVPLVEPSKRGPKPERAKSSSAKTAKLLPETKVDITPVPPKKSE